MAQTLHFHPAQPKQEKLSFECSLPQSKSSIRKVTKALPYPFDISEALDYSAAYVDHAAHLAKHALEQFNALQEHHHDLHDTSASQIKQIEDLKHHVRVHEQDICGLNSKYAELEQQRERDAKTAKAREDALKKELAETQAALKKAQKDAAADEVDDAKRNHDYEDHISADHLKMRHLEERAVKAEAQVVKLQGLLDTSNKKLAVAEASLKTVREQLTKSQASVSKLTKDLLAEKQAKERLEVELTAATTKLTAAETEIRELDNSLTMKAALLADANARVAAKDKEVTRVTNERDGFKNTAKEKEDEVNALEKTMENTIASLMTDHARALKKRDEMKTPTVGITEIVPAH